MRASKCTDKEMGRDALGDKILMNSDWKTLLP